MELYNKTFEGFFLIKQAILEKKSLLISISIAHLDLNFPLSNQLGKQNYPMCFLHTISEIY